MNLLRRLVWFFTGREEEEETGIPEEEPKKSFSFYIKMTPRIVTYLRREQGIARRDLELVLVDDDERPAYQILEIAKALSPDPKLFYIVTERPEAFKEFAEEIMDEQGLLVVLLQDDGSGYAPGNLLLDTRDWEKHLDIISALSYNTVIM